jgi:type IV fimbrial biogenesis protein FimT
MIMMVGYTPFAPKSVRGFTLIEMMVVISIVAILTFLAIPSFVETIKRYHVAAIKDELEASIHLARAEAIRRGVQVILSRTTGCGKTLVDSGDWGCGWEMVIDSNADSIKTVGEQILQTYSIPGNYLLNHFAGAPQSLAFNVWGQVTVRAHRFVIKPYNTTSEEANTTLCINSGSRLKTVAGSSTCP